RSRGLPSAITAPQGIHLQRRRQTAFLRQQACYQPGWPNLSTAAQPDAALLEAKPAASKRMLSSTPRHPVFRELPVLQRLQPRFSFLRFHTEQGTTDTRDLRPGLPTPSGQQNPASAPARHWIVIPA